MASDEERVLREPRAVQNAGRVPLVLPRGFVLPNRAAESRSRFGHRPSVAVALQTLTEDGSRGQIKIDGSSYWERFSRAASMTQIEAIQAEIASLSREDFARLRDWIAERDWQDWDQQIERDSAAGKLDFLQDEVRAAKQQGKLREL